jgi:hypothetical protein
MAPRRQRRAHAAHLGHAAQDTAAVKLVCWRVQAQRETPRFRSNPKRSLSVSAPGCEPGPVAMRTDNKRTAETQPCSYSTKLQGFYKVSLQWAQSTPAAQKIDRDNNMISIVLLPGAGRRSECLHGRRAEILTFNGGFSKVAKHG